MPTEDASRSTSLRRLIDEAQVLSHQARTQYRQARGRGNVNQQHVDQLRDAMLRQYDALKRYKNKTVISQDWEDFNFDQITAWLNQTVAVEQPKADAPWVTEEVHVPMIRQMGPERIVQIMEQLDSIATELGFAAEIDERTPKEIGTVEDVKWLLTVRGQTPALEDLDPPEQPEELVTDGGVVAEQPATQRPTGPGETSPDVARYPFRGPFFQEISKRKDQGKDAKITVASANAETGVGKSTCAYYLGLVLDTSPGGFVASEKATLTVEEFLEKYDLLKKGSSMILDEAEQIDSRRAMREKNVQAGRRWETRRVQEICAILTLPKFSGLDSRMRDLVDYRVEVEQRGRAMIYKKRHKRFSGDTWWDPVQTLEFPNMDFAPGMEDLHSLKDQFTDGEGGERYIRESEVDDEIEQEAEKAAQKARYEEWCKAYANGKTFDNIAEGTDVSAEWIRQVWHDHHEEFGLEREAK